MDMHTAPVAPAGGGMIQSMKRMMGSMTCMKISGYFDADYANAIIAHHKGALDTAQMEVAQGKNEKIKAFYHQAVFHHPGIYCKPRRYMISPTHHLKETVRRFLCMQ